MSDKRAYALKETIHDFAGGSTTVTDGKRLDFGARLKNNDGVIVTSDGDEIRALEMVDSLKSVPVPDESSAKSDSKKGEVKA